MKKGMLIVVLFIINIIVGCFLFGYIYYHFEPNIHNYIQSIREYRRNSKLYDTLWHYEYDVNTLKILECDTNAWYCKYMVECHGGGGIDGKINTNCLEGWYESYRRGIRLFDADINMTRDNKVVLCHSWEDNVERTGERINRSLAINNITGYPRYICTYNPLSSLEFKERKIFGRYTPMILEDMLEFMINHNDIFVVAHINSDCNISETYNSIIETCIQMKGADLLDRIIMSVASEEEVFSIKRIRPNTELALRFYSDQGNYTRALKICVDNDIHVIMMAQKFVEPDVVNLFKSHGVHIFVGTIEYDSEFDYYIDMGCSGCVSDFLYERK